jgi:transposase
MQFYCGIDLGARKTHVCLIDEDDNKLLDMKMYNDFELIEMYNDFELIEAVLRPYKSSLEVVVESTINWEWLVYGLRKYGYEVKLAHTLGLKAITWSKKKTDTWDAFTLAKLLRGRLIPQAYIYPYELRPVRDLVRERIRLVTKRATEYGAINRMLLKYNIQGFDRNSVKHLSEKDMHELYHHPFVRVKATMELQRIELLTEQIRLIEKALFERARQDTVFSLLQTIPGIGDVLALTILYEVGDIDRFAHVRGFCSYSRVVPGIHQSSGKAYRSPHSKQGNRYLKWAFSQAAIMAIRYYPEIRRLHERLAAKRKKAARLVARSIIAHKLAQAAFHVMKHHVEYKEELLFRFSQNNAEGKTVTP